MSVAVERFSTVGAGADRAMAVEERKLRPILAWALVGAMFLALQVYVYTKWITGPNFGETNTGPDAVPQYMKVLITVQLPLGFILLGAFGWHFLIKPWRRDGRPSFDGLMVVGWMSMYWMDGLCNYYAPLFTYNSYVPNSGSWFSDVPGWMSPNGGNLAEPPLLVVPLYVYGFMAGVFFANFVMRRSKRQWPQIGKFGLIMVAWVTLMVFDLVIETAWMRTGLYAWPGAIKGLTLWYGKWYQFPIYESVVWGAGWAAFASWRYFRNDRGDSVAERGIERVKLSSGKKTALRFLAIMGMTQSIFLVFYCIPIQFFATKASTPPPAFQQRSYFMDEICGKGTDYACPGARIPLAHRNSAHLRPDGTLAPGRP
jgi:hypothetical protein